MEKNLRFLELLFQLFPGAIQSAHKEKSLLKIFFDESLLESFFQNCVKTPFPVTQKTVSDFFQERIALEKSIHSSWHEAFQIDLPESLRSLAQILFSTNREEQSVSISDDNPLTTLCKDWLLGRSRQFQIDMEEEKDGSNSITSSSISWMLSLSHAGLIDVIDLLGMIDVAEEVRYIVNKKELQTLFSALREIQKKYLKSLLGRPLKPTRSSLDILHTVRLGGEKEAICRVIHRSGLKKLSLALVKESPSFLWHLIHRLDMPRGLYMKNFIKNEQETGGTKDTYEQQDLILLAHVHQFIQNEQGNSTSG